MATHTGLGSVHISQLERNSASTMEILQQALDRELANVPVLYLQNLISRKLREQGIKNNKELSAKIAKHILSGDRRPFRNGTGSSRKTVNLSIDDAEIDEIIRQLHHFFDNQLDELLPALARRVAKSVLKHLKSRWPDEEKFQNADFVEFRRGLEERWSVPLGQLRMLLTMSREWCQWTLDRENSLGNKRKKKWLKEILVRLLVRGCQVTDEIICLLQNGFADGAMARWRTLHEITVVAAVISQHGESIAERYIAHQAVESKRAMDKYLGCCAQLGYKPLSAREQEKIQLAFDKAISQYGKSFKSDYGWAAAHLKKDRPTFADLEKEAGRSEMRSHYQMSNDNVHAGVKSMYVRLGLIDGYTDFLSGRSNAGLVEPGQNAAHTLTQLSALVCLSDPNFDDIAASEMMRMLRDEIPRSFYRADKQLLRDHKQIRKLRSSE